MSPRFAKINAYPPQERVRGKNTAEDGVSGGMYGHIKSGRSYKDIRQRSGGGPGARSRLFYCEEEGEFTAIVGASGSGKSTLLHLIGGVDRPTSGKVYVDGTDVYAQDEEALAIFRRRQVGLIYQFYNLIPVLTVRENITVPGADGRKRGE